MTRPDAIIVAAEPSGDQLGAALAQSLLDMKPSLQLEAIGGERLASVGLPSAVSTEGLAILGFVEGLRAYPHVLRKVREVSDYVLVRNPRSVVLIDSWGFMVRVAKRLKAKGYAGHVVKYVSPQVWAMRPGRAKVLARHVDHLLSTQPMDAPCYEGTGLPLTYVGNPVFDTDYRAGDAAGFRRHFDLSEDTKVLAVFPGSRDAELERLLPVLQSHTAQIREGAPQVSIVWVTAEAIREAWSDRIRAAAGPGAIIVKQTGAIDVMAVATAALAASGTVTTQLACAGVPTVVIYKLSALTYAVAKRLFRPSHISIVNIAANAPLMPEFMQDNVDSPAVADAVLRYLTDADARKAASAALISQTDAMGAGQQNASDRAAEALLSILGKRSA